MSEKVLGVVLCKLKVNSYASRTSTPAKTNYHVHSGKLEFLPLKWSATEKFCNHLYFANKFKFCSDNNPLSYVMIAAKLNAKGMRCVSELADFNFKVKYRAGKSSPDCNYLSRNRVEVKFLKLYRGNRF